MTLRIGQNLVDVVQNAQSELWLVAPFIKVNALSRLLNVLAPQVQVFCVTRWRPEEIAMGVSDIDVWLLLKEKGNSQLWLRNDLHAKYYRADKTCLIGSANLTATALGWSPNPNLELLMDVPPNHPSLFGFEAKLIAGAILVNDGLYEQTKNLAVQLRPEIQILSHPEQATEFTQISGVDREMWLPALRNPEQLYWAYLDEVDRFSSGIYDVALADLQILNIPKGLSRAKFEAYVGYVLVQMPVVQKVDIFVRQPRRFGEVSSYLKTLPCGELPQFDGKFAWQTLMRWFLYFLPQKYKNWTDSYTEMFSVKLTD